MFDLGQCLGATPFHVPGIWSIETPPLVSTPMLVTKDFVMINLPKTGSTFARRALLRLHEPTWLQKQMEKAGLRQPSVSEHMMAQIFFTDIQSASNPKVEQHGAVRQIPEGYRHLPIMSVIRDPEERLISLYEFRSWERQPFPDRERLVQRFPHFPNLTFEEFLEMMHEMVPFAQPDGMRTQIGMLTIQFIRFYARDPLKTMLALRDDTDLLKDYTDHFPPVRFLHTENLNIELYDYLIELGYPIKKVDFILEMQKLNTSKRTRPTYFTDDHRKQIRSSERLLFQLFPEYAKDIGVD